LEEAFLEKTSVPKGDEEKRKGSLNEDRKCDSVPGGYFSKGKKHLEKKKKKVRKSRKTKTGSTSKKGG